MASGLSTTTRFTCSTRWAMRPFLRFFWLNSLITALQGVHLLRGGERVQVEPLRHRVISEMASGQMGVRGQSAVTTHATAYQSTHRTHARTHGYLFSCMNTIRVSVLSARL